MANSITTTTGVGTIPAYTAGTGTVAIADNHEHIIGSGTTFTTDFPTPYTVSGQMYIHFESANEVRKVVKNWRHEARALGISEKEQSKMAYAFRTTT